ncbi:MAG: hypothetical protein WCE24_12225 [Pseudolabrys sp.]|jgi:hypothetical protein
MIAIEAFRILPMSAVVRVVTCDVKVRKRARGQRDLSVGHTFGNLDATDVKPKHQRRDKREFDSGSAAPVAAEVTRGTQRHCFHNVAPH